MADKKKEDKQKVLKGSVVCITKCHHGKMFQVGEVTTVETLKRLGSNGFVPVKHFAQADSPKALEATEGGEKKKEELKLLKKLEDFVLLLLTMGTQSRCFVRVEMVFLRHIRQTLFRLFWLPGKM